MFVMAMGAVRHLIWFIPLTNQTSKPFIFIARGFFYLGHFLTALSI